MAGKIKRKAAAEQFVALMANPESDISDAQLAKQLKVSRQTIKNWKKHPELIKKIERTVHQFTDSSMPDVWESLIQSAVSGDVQAAKLIFQLRGELDKKELPAVQTNPPKVTIHFHPVVQQQPEKGADQ